MQHVMMFSENENIKKGTTFYLELAEKERERLETQRRITQKALARRAGDQTRTPIGMNVSGNGRERTTIMADKGGPMLSGP